MLEAFKIKPFDLEPVLTKWTDAPVFTGNPKKDPPVAEWLEKIRLGCVERKVPEECWHKVAQHYMGPDARARLTELKQVIAKVHGGKYRWTWKKYKVAMEHMGWEIDKSTTETIKVSKTTGSWWSLRKKEEQKVEEPASLPEPPQAQRPQPSRSDSSFWSLKRRDSGMRDESPPPLPPPSDSKKGNETPPTSTRRKPTRSNTDFWPMRKVEEPGEIRTPHKRAASTSRTDVEVTSRPGRRNTDAGSTTVTQAPVWLLNACSALEFITAEHPKAMNIISAILITAGSIPAIPAISAGAGGTILASHAAQAIGALAVGLGQAISTTTKAQQDKQEDVKYGGGSVTEH